MTLDCLSRPRLERVVVIGSSCAGKTTFARNLATLLECPAIELDELHWGPNWNARPADEFAKLADTATSAPRWVVDGNYGVIRDIVWPRATAIVWLNIGFFTVLVRALRRTLVRSLTGEVLYAGNRESLRRAFSPAIRFCGGSCRHTMIGDGAFRRCKQIPSVRRWTGSSCGTQAIRRSSFAAFPAVSRTDA